MAAPAAAFQYSYSFRDAKAQVGHMRFTIGDATQAAADADAQTLKAALAAVTNCHVRLIGFDFPDDVRGATAQFQNVEDKAELLFIAPSGYRSRFQLPAPIATMFMADLETPNNANAAFGTLKAAIETFVYAHPTDTAPLTYVGGIRVRRRYQRRTSLYQLSPGLDEPAE